MWLAEEENIKKRGMRAPSNDNLSTLTNDVMVNPRNPVNPDSK